MELYTHNYARRWVRFIQIFLQVKVEEHAAPVLCHGTKRAGYRLTIIVFLVVIHLSIFNEAVEDFRGKGSMASETNTPEPTSTSLSRQRAKLRRAREEARKTALCSYGSINVSLRLLEE